MLSKSIKDSLYKPDSVKFQKPAGRFMTEEESKEFAQRANSKVAGGGDVYLHLTTLWRGYSRCARNTIVGSGDIRQNSISLGRDILGASAGVRMNQINDIGVEAAVRRTERLLKYRPFFGGRQFREHFAPLDSIGLDSNDESSTVLNQEEGADVLKHLIQTVEPYSKPKIFFDSTYSMQVGERLEALRPSIERVNKQRLFTAAYVEATAKGRVIMDTIGRSLYYPYTESQFSLTVRDPEASGSGWAGVDWSDWDRVDSELLTEVALDKCLRSRNPVAVEPGRYTTVLEPQAVSDILSPLIASSSMDRQMNMSQHGNTGPFGLPDYYTKIGMKIMDERITISSNPMDPDIGFPPFSVDGHVYNPVTWIEKGVLKELAYFRRWAIRFLGVNSGLPNSGAYRMEGGTSSLEDMVLDTRRGIYVTRLVRTGGRGELLSGYTRDGLWLIENGKISKPIKNFQFLEAPLFIFNQLDALGPAVKVFRPGYPTIVPSAKVRDFNFVKTIDAV